MKVFDTFQLDPNSCNKEIEAFGSLLEENRLLSERDQILPFFRDRRHLSAFIGSYIPGMDTVDRVAHEFSLFGDFATDIALGDSKKQIYCFVEFEDAKPNSLFRKIKSKATLEWAPRFEHGFSQIVDWFWKLDDMRSTTDFRSKFGDGYVQYFGLLVVGRSEKLEYKEQMRLKWRLDRVLVDSKCIFCLTYDELYKDLRNRFDSYYQVFLSG